MAAKKVNKKAVAGMTTEHAAAPKRRRKPGPRMVILASIAMFALITTFMAQRVAAGTDPVLGAVRRVPPPQPVIVRRIMRKVIVETTVSSHSHEGTSSYSSSPVTTSQSSSGPAITAPVTRSS